MPPPRGEGMTDRPSRLSTKPGNPAMEQTPHPNPLTPSTDTTFLRPTSIRRTASASRTLRPLRGRPPADPRPRRLTGAPQNPAENTETKTNGLQPAALTDPTPSGMTYVRHASVASRRAGRTLFARALIARRLRSSG